MKNLVITAILVIFTLTVQAQLIGSFTISTEGGVKGTGNEFTPQLELYALNNNNDIETLIFDNENVSNETILFLKKMEMLILIISLISYLRQMNIC